MSIQQSNPPVIRVVATTLTDLHAGPSFLSEMLTQVTNGVDLEVLKEEGEWCYVRQRDGYVGWAHGPYLADVSALPAAMTHIVAESTLLLYRDSDAHSGPITRVPIGSSVHVAEERGEWARIQLAGNITPVGWARSAELRPLASPPLPAGEAREQIVADARRLTGVYYLWGGCTAWGIDCSGLTQLCHRLAGYTLARDAGLQFPAGLPVEPPYRPGDLLFFHGEADREKIVHVGISTGGWRMIHSSRSRNGVYEEDLDDNTNLTRKLRNRFAGARSFLD